MWLKLPASDFVEYVIQIANNRGDAVFVFGQEMTGWNLIIDAKYESF